MECNNALAELAAELKRSLDLQLQGTSYYRDRTIFCTPEVIDKSMRIVAELAKVQDEEAALFSMKYITADEARRIVRQREGNCILKCRAIAEEGAKDEERTGRTNT